MIKLFIIGAGDMNAGRLGMEDSDFPIETSIFSPLSLLTPVLSPEVILFFRRASPFGLSRRDLPSWYRKMIVGVKNFLLKFVKGWHRFLLSLSLYT